ncbi:MotE family protein [Marinicrinis sediminis]|uniref:MotE family protein n=1 Tax=Marinicrinis sediminis TaxID=1652465 RepID=A0ABW5R5S5_9BACL
MADLEVKEKSSYGAFERFLYLFLIPIVFTSILTVVLLSMFNYNVMNSLLRVADSIPLVNMIVPDPATNADEEQPDGVDGDPVTTDAGPEQLAMQIAELETKISNSRDVITRKDSEIEKLREQIEKLQEDLATKQQTDEEYQTRISNLAQVYADMTASKAAAIMENLTTPELVLILNQMGSDDQSRILEKMNPVIAAEASIQMKDEVTAKDQQIAALQARLDIQEGALTPETKFSMEELGQTFANMSTKSAASVLMEMYASDPNKVINILRVMNVGSRSEILDEIADESKTTAAEISRKLS